MNTPRIDEQDRLGSSDMGASQATGLGSAEAPEPHSGLGPSGAIPSASLDENGNPLWWYVGVGLSVALANGKRATRKWVVKYRGEIVSRHQWRENAEYRAKQMIDALKSGFVPASERDQ